MVIKKDGTKVKWDIDKIRKQIKPACEGTSISPIEFESLLQIDSHTNIKTSDIQERLVITAKNNVSRENPDWNIVAGRLMSHQLFREVWKNTKIDFSNFKEHFEYLLRNNYYRQDLKDMYNDQEIRDISYFLDESRDYNLILSQVMLLRSKYLLKNKRGTIEYPSTADITNSMILASIEKDKMFYVKEYYDLLSTYIISLGTPFKSNMRIPNGNTGSCFIGESGDNLNSIMKGYTDKAVISKEGGGIGWYFGKIRPHAAYSYRVPKANNINKWIKLVNDIAVAVNQRGVRKGAITPALDWWHLDIIDFIEMKSELNGDLRDKCFDVFPQVVVDSYFIDKKENNEDVYQFDQYEFKKLTGTDITELIGEELYKAHEEAEELIKSGKLKHFNKINSKTLWTKFLEVWIEYGDFYISHKDNINISNYMSEFGIAKCVNLCTESFSFSKVSTKWRTEVNEEDYKTTETDGLIHSCSLCSINVANILNDDVLLERACKAAVRILDSSVDLGTMPVQEAKNSAELIRNIGVGVVGMADWMAYNELLYDTEEGTLGAEKLFEKIAWYCYNASTELAIEKGSYPGIVHANYSTLFGKTPEALVQRSAITGNNFKWDELQKQILDTGIRNMLILAPAPNTSSALVQGVIASYLPAHAKDSTQKVGEMVVPILPKFIKSKFWYYKTKFQYRTEDLIKFTTNMQRWVDTGMSMECPINSELTNIKKISDAILHGFKNKELKAVYYSLSIDGNKAACTDCAN